MPGIKKHRNGKKRLTPAAAPLPEIPGPIKQLISLGIAGNKEGCQQLIPSLTQSEINFVVDEKSGTTLLMKAIEFTNSLWMVELLLLHGANVMAVNAAKDTVVSIACKKGYVDTVRILRPHLTEAYSESLVGAAAAGEQPESTVLSIVSILLGKDMDCKPSAAEINVDDDAGQDLFAANVTTTLHSAAAAGYPKVLSMLLMHGHSKYMMCYDEKGNSPLQVAEAKYRECQGVMFSRPDYRKYKFRNGKKILRNRYHEGHSVVSDETTGNARSLNEEDVAWEECDDEMEVAQASGRGARGGRGRGASGMFSHPGDNSDEDEEDISESAEAEEDHQRSRRRHKRFQPPKRYKAERKDSNVVKGYRDCILLLVNEMGHHQALYSDYALNTMMCFKLVVSEIGIPALLNPLAADFKMTPWGRAALGVPSDGTRACIPVGNNGCPFCPTKGHEMAVSTRTPARYALVSWQCNACGVRGKKTSERWFCETCEDDYCMTCVPPAAPENTTRKINKIESKVADVESTSFVDALSEDLKVTSIEDTKTDGSKKGKGKKEKKSKPVREKGGKPPASAVSAQRSSRLVDDDKFDLPEEEKYLSSPDIGFEEPEQTDLFIEALTVISQLHRGASTREHGMKVREEALVLWTAATNPEHSLGLLQERTLRAIMWVIFDASSDITDANVIVEWATILQDYTNDNVHEHVLPPHCYGYLNMSSSVATTVPTDPIQVEPLSYKLVLDPLYTLCHPSVTTELLLRITDMGLTIAFGLTGQNWDEEDSDQNPDELMARDLQLFSGYIEMLLKVVLPRLFPVYEATRTIENESAYRSPKTGYYFGEDGKRKRSSASPISMIDEVASRLCPDIAMMFGSLESAIGMVNGALMEDQSERLMSLMGGVYLWELLSEVTTFDPKAVDRYLSGPHAPLLNYMSNATPPLAKGGAKNGRRNANNRFHKNNAVSTDESTVTQHSVRSFDGLWLGEKWRFFIDAMSCHSKALRKIDLGTRNNEPPQIARLPIHTLTGPVICVRPTAEEVTALLLKATSDLSADAKTGGESAKKSNSRQNRSKRHERNAGTKNSRQKNVSDVRCVTNMAVYLLMLSDASHPLKIPRPEKFGRLLSNRGESVRWLVSSYPGALYGVMKYLMRFPSTLGADQILSHVNDSLYDLTQNSGDDVITIILNRFTDPSVWVESIVQQLLVYDRSLYKKSLGIEYDDEPGTGPGPIKEFFELTRILFDIKPLSKKSLSDMMTGKNKPKQGTTDTKSPESTPMKSGKPDPDGKDAVASSVPYERTSVAGVMMADLLPLFQPAGDCNPTALLPVAIDVICERFPLLLTKNQKESIIADADEKTGGAVVTDSAEKGGEKRKTRGKRGSSGNRSTINSKLSESERQLRANVGRAFEAIGVLLGHSIRNECPMGIHLPAIVWALLLGDKPTDFNWVDFCGDDKQLFNSCSTILGEEKVEDLQMNFESTTSIYHVSKMDALNGETSAAVDGLPPPAPSLQRANSSVSGGLTITHIKRDFELILNGSSTLVTNANKHKFVKLYAEVACLNNSQASIAAIRRGLLRVIPQEYLAILSPAYIMKQVRGEDTISVPALRGSVIYEGGFSASHRVIRMFWHMIETEFSADDIRRLLLFWTGNSVAPSNGFKDDVEEDERLVIAKMTNWSQRDENLKAKLPEASTCDKHLYLPGYATIDDMRTAVRAAIVYSCLGYDRL